MLARHSLLAGIAPLQTVSAGYIYENKESCFLNSRLKDIQRQQLLQKLNFIPVITTDSLLYSNSSP